MCVDSTVYRADVRQARLSVDLRGQDIYEPSLLGGWTCHQNRLPEAWVFHWDPVPQNVRPFLLPPTEPPPQPLTLPACLLKLCGMEIITVSGSVNSSFLSTRVTEMRFVLLLPGYASTDVGSQCRWKNGQSASQAPAWPPPPSITCHLLDNLVYLVVEILT